MTVVDRKALFALVYAATGLAGIYYLKSPDNLAVSRPGTLLDDVGPPITQP